ncbi:BLOC-3 complex member HPS1-like isoform X2 [Sycon ciliatum]|uniref:BLOC-3 complex member HPS1-like isoform X2 n=1 Tax=Sycon ciliatum TaxID=27933 RepID=UPI0031F6C237
MKCVIAFGAMSEVWFLWSDPEFSEHMRSRAIENGYHQASEGWSWKAELDATTQFFIPICQSQTVLVDVGNSYSSMTCKNGFKLVFHQFSEMKCMAVNGDGQESVDFLVRKLHVFQRLVGLHFGPAVEELKNCDRSKQRALWETLGHELNTWAHLYATEQAFLVECIERVQVRQELNEMCIGLLEAALDRAHSDFDRNVVHGWLLVDTKLLALFSSRNAPELHSPDLLLITALVKSRFLYNSSEIDTAPNTADVSQTVSPRPSSTSSEHSDHHLTPSPSPDPDYTHELSPSPDNFYSPISSPVAVPPESPVVTDKESDFYSPASHPATPYSACHRSSRTSSDAETNPEAYAAGFPGQTPSFTPRSRPGSGILHSTPQKTPPPVVEEPPSPFDDLDDITAEALLIPPASQPKVDVKQTFSDLVFLRTVACPYSPHSLHCTRILPGTVLVIVSTCQRSQVAGLICQSLAKLPSAETPVSAILDPARSSARLVVELLEGNVRRIADLLRRSKDPVKTMCKNIARQFERLKKCNLQKFLELNGELPELELSRLDSSSTTLATSLRDLFRHLFCVNKTSATVKQRQQVCMDEIRVTLHDKLKDWHMFLTTKALRNIPMTTYWKDFPGLVHFIYIDRTTDQAIVPSLNTQDDKLHPGGFAAAFEGMPAMPAGNNPGGIVKEKVWCMCQFARSMLRKGFTSVAIRDGDFLYSYMLWFEDQVGNNLSAPRTLGSLVTNRLPGILAGNFYKDLVRQCFPAAPSGSIHCYELLCLHVGIVPSHFVGKQARRLASQLWDQSGANSPFSLI